MDRLRQRADFLAVADGARISSEVVKRADIVAMRPHHDYVVVGRRAALTRDFAALLDDFRMALKRLDRQPARPRRAQAATGLNDENPER